MGSDGEDEEQSHRRVGVLRWLDASSGLGAQLHCELPAVHMSCRQLCVAQCSWVYTQLPIYRQLQFCSPACPLPPARPLVMGSALEPCCPHPRHLTGLGRPQAVATISQHLRSCCCRCHCCQPAQGEGGGRKVMVCTPHSGPPPMDAL
jgi:hypothetical protein